MKKTQLAYELYLTSPIYNASCPIAVTYKQLDELEESWSGAVLTKSCTVNSNELKDNEMTLKRYEYDLKTRTSFNKNGLLNPGLDYYLKYRKKKSDKPYIISFAINSPDDYTKLLDCLNKAKYLPKSIELNLSCPNYGPDSHYIEKLNKTLMFIRNNGYIAPVLGLKLRPAFDIRDIDLIFELVRECIPIKYIVCSNTIPRGMSPTTFVGAVGGQSLKPVSLWNVYEYRRRLSSDISIVGCGGVFNTKDFDQYLRVGATAVQMGTSLYEHNLTGIQQILEEYKGVSAKI